MRTDPDALADVVEEWHKSHPGQRMMLVVDQFEELVTLRRNDEEHELFLTLLARAIRTHPEWMRVVLTLRSDFEPQFAESSLAALWASSARYVVPPLSQDELRQVIEGPASERVLYFEPYELVEELINEVVQTPGALPLLSFTLSELYLKYLEGRRDNRALTMEDYRELGGVIGSLRTQATGTYDSLPDDAHRATMRRIMLRMVAVEAARWPGGACLVRNWSIPMTRRTSGQRPWPGAWWRPGLW